MRMAGLKCQVGKKNKPFYRAPLSVIVSALAAREFLFLMSFDVLRTPFLWVMTMVVGGEDLCLAARNKATMLNKVVWWIGL
jgi:hypothetical protein